MTTNSGRAGSRGPDATSGWERHLPLAGFAAVALFVLVFVVSEAGQPPTGDAPAEQVAAFFVTGANSILLSQYVLALAVLFLLVFIASLFDVLRGSDGVALPARLGFASGVATSILMLASAAPHLTAVWASQERGAVSPATAEALWHLPQGIFNIAFLPAAVMLATISFLTLRTGRLPRWLGWLTAAAAVSLLVPFFGWGIFAPVLALWVLVTTVPVWRASVRRQTVGTSPV